MRSIGGAHHSSSTSTLGRSPSALLAVAVLVVALTSLALPLGTARADASGVAWTGLDDLVVGREATVSATFTAPDGVAADAPLRLVGAVSGGPVSLTHDGVAVTVADDGTFVLPPLHLPPWRGEDMRDLARGQDVTMTLTVPDTAVRTIDVALQRSNEEGAAVRRLAGPDRHVTAARIAQAMTARTGLTVYVARADSFPDALAAGPSAALGDSPILLTDSGSLGEAAAQELRRLSPTRVVVLGGPAAIDDGVVADIESLVDATVVRLSGQDRYATAAAVALDSHPDGADTVLVAAGDRFADALAGGATAAHHGAPLLLVGPHAPLPGATSAALRALAPRRVIVLGGEAAIDAEVLGLLAAYAPDGIVRLSGDDRYATAAAVSRATFIPDDVTRVTVATGEDFPDALAGTPFAAGEGGPMLLVRRDAVPAAVAEEITRLGVGTVTVLGGPMAVGEEVLADLADLIGAVLPDPDRFADVAAGQPVEFAARGATGPSTGGGDPGAGAPPLHVDAPTTAAPHVLRPGDRFPVTVRTIGGGDYVVSWRPTDSHGWQSFNNPTASGTVGAGTSTISLNAPLTDGVVDLQVTITPASAARTRQSSTPTTVVVKAAVHVALTFPPPLISGLVEATSGQSQLIAVRPAGGLEEGTRLDIELSAGELRGVDYPDTTNVALLGGTGTARFEMTRDRVARVVYTAGPGDRVPGDDPTAHPLLRFRIDGIATDDQHRSHVGRFFRYDINHGVSRVFTVGTGPSIASPTASNLPAGSPHTFQELTFALREPMAPFERLDIDLTEAETTVADYAEAFAVVQQPGGGHEPDPVGPPLGSAFLDVEPDSTATLTVIAGPDGIPSVQPEGPTVSIFVGGIAVGPNGGQVTSVPFIRPATGEITTATFTLERRSLVDVTADDLARQTADQQQTLGFTLDGAMPDGGGAFVVLPRQSPAISYAGADVTVAAGNGGAYLHTFDGTSYLSYESYGDADGDRVQLRIDGIDTGPVDLSEVIRLERYDSSSVSVAVFDIGDGSVLAGPGASSILADTSDAWQELTFTPTRDLDAGEAVTVTLDAAEQGLVDYDGAFAEVYEFGGAADEPGTVVLGVVPDTGATVTYSAGPDGVPAGTQVVVYLSGLRTDAGTATYPATFTTSDGSITTSFQVRPEPSFAEVTASDLVSGSDGQTQVLTATLRGDLAPGDSVSVGLWTAEHGAARYGGARVIASGDGRATLYVFSGEYAEVSYQAGPTGVPDGSTITLELRGVNVDSADETHVAEFYRSDSGSVGRALFDIGAGGPFIGIPWVDDLVSGGIDQYQGISVTLTNGLAAGESLTVDLSAAHAGIVDYGSAYVDFLHNDGTAALDVAAGSAVVTFTAGPAGVAAGEQVFLYLAGVTAEQAIATYDVEITAGAVSTTTSFDVFAGHG